MQDRENVVVCRLLRICLIFALLLGVEGVESLGAGRDSGRDVIIKANTADIVIKGEVKDIINVEFYNEKKELSLFEDNGEDTHDSCRTFRFYIRTMNNTGAKLKLDGSNGLSFDESSRCWVLSRANDKDENSKILIWFQLMGRARSTEDEDGALEQRGWDKDGCCYTFKSYDGVGEWRIIARSLKRITDEASGVYMGTLKVSIVAV